MNPEFLQEGRALKDSMQPSRIVVGCEDSRAGRLLMSLYEPLEAPKMITDLRSAEMIKYASNVGLATKISFANDVANICVRFGIDSETVLKAVGLDPRIGPQFLKPGLGFGGSCLPKDVRALFDRARGEGYESRLLSSIMKINEGQPLEGIRLLEGAIGNLSGKRIAVLGLSFKGGVDDIRETRAVPLIKGLRAKGAKVVAYDPMAMKSFRKIMPRIEYASSAIDCVDGADACILQADWPEFRRLGASAFRKMRNPVVVDGRRFLDPDIVKKARARYLGIGYGQAGQQ
jgi:UDPglucose 6-dehydrogenase